MTTAPVLHARRAAKERARSAPPNEWTWLGVGLIVAFVVPFVFADVLEVPRDAYYAIYVAATLALLGGWLFAERRPLTAFLAHRWRWGLSLGAVTAVLTTFVVLAAEDASARPEALELAGAVLWRGVVYGAIDGLLLSVFPILVVYAALRPHRRGWLGKLGVGAAALAASLAMTAVYHAGYSDFRGEKLRNPVAGDVVWSAPTLLTASPLGAPIAHAAMHVTAVVHSYDTDLFLPPHRAAAAPYVRADLQTLLEAMVGGTNEAPGAIALVQTPSGTWVGTAGTANLATGRATAADDRFPIGSATKTFTAALVLQLVDEGKLALDDTVERRLPDALPYGDRITIRQLLNHTAGLRHTSDEDFPPAEQVAAKIGNPALRAQADELVRRAAAGEVVRIPPRLWIAAQATQPLLFEPGTSFHYSNVGYETLGLIAERATGRSLTALMEARIFRPLGLDHTYLASRPPIRGGDTRGYDVDGAAPVDVTNELFAEYRAAGAIVSTAGDLARFYSALVDGSVLSDERFADLTTLAWTPRTWTGISSDGYGLGLIRYDLRCGSAWGHGGSVAGFLTMALVDRTGEHVVVVAHNGNGARPVSSLRLLSTALYCRS